MAAESEACREIIDRLLKISEPTTRDLENAKILVSAARGLGSLPGNSDILEAGGEALPKSLRTLLTRKKVRSVSGVNVVAVMTQPSRCPHGTCSYCPGGIDFGSPQSYTGHEPAAMRGSQHDFDPAAQVSGRIAQLRQIGHDVDKVDLIIMGGTFTSTLTDYQESFVKGCLDAITGASAHNLAEAKEIAESSRTRNVGITVETRPDWAGEDAIRRMLNYGVTRVELGVQIPDDAIYHRVKRGHTVQDVKDATRRLKDAGLKVCYHMMPGLPGSTVSHDLEAFERIFTLDAFKPDMLKIYPCLVVEGTELYEWWKRGEYKPYSTEEAVDVIVEVKKRIPPWVRIMRVQRDIPSPLIVDGVKHSNLRQLALGKLRQLGGRCRCIRCREVGHRMLAEGFQPTPEDVRITTTRYTASDGVEVFISAEDTASDTLIGYLRLRLPSSASFMEEVNADKSALIRELHIYGFLVPVGKRLQAAWQHRGYGGTLLAAAEAHAREKFDCRKILVTSALGTKRYYARFGYRHDGSYMSKRL
ncbi:MAG: tRNA uridine(34) 5-carboxymethylaminomethyl modification radical SAM/GNAT enzyme Elp3 [Candidatus Bathyarchaeia archaeon]